MLLMNSKNWVAWTIEYGIPDVRISASSTSFARKYPAVVFVRSPPSDKLLRSDDRQRDVMADPRGRLGDEQVVGRGREEVERRRVLEVGRVRHVDDDRCAVERRGEPFAGDRVDAEPGRGRDGLVAVLGEPGDDLRADQPGAADDDDLHDSSCPPCSHVALAGSQVPVTRCGHRGVHGEKADARAGSRALFGQMTQSAAWTTRLAVT